MIHFGRATHSFGGYYLNSVSLDSVNCHKDLSIIFDANVKFHLHASEVAMKVNSRVIHLISDELQNRTELLKL